MSAITVTNNEARDTIIYCARNLFLRSTSISQQNSVGHLSGTVNVLTPTVTDTEENKEVYLKRLFRPSLLQTSLKPILQVCVQPGDRRWSSVGLLATGGPPNFSIRVAVYHTKAKFCLAVTRCSV